MMETCEKFGDQHNVKVKIMERGGRKITTDVKGEPINNGRCKREGCISCQSGKKCIEKLSVTYEYDCNWCKEEGVEAKYYGETSKGLRARAKQHAADLVNKNETNAMVKHCIIQHGGEAAEFSVTVKGVFQKPMQRQIHEAVMIERSEAAILMNSRSEFRQAPIIRVVTTRGLLQTQEERGERRAGPRLGIR